MTVAKVTNNVIPKRSLEFDIVGIRIITATWFVKFRTSLRNLSFRNGHKV